MSQGNAKILLVTDCNPQSQLFMDYISEQLGLQISAVGPHDVSDDIECENRLVLLDADHVDENSMQQWHHQTVECQHVILAAFNLRDEDHAAEILAALHLHGVFYRRDSLKLICKGIDALLKGDLWMSRSLMTRLIQFYRRQQLNAYRPVCSLTHREQEIISLLGSGASNTEIADKLFVSEHTVKSHLYNTFRKIKVHNRIQAMNWARQNLGPLPPIHSHSRHRKSE
ncbi:LuxR C-terminal-related transcriptional regulator [Modicisalibacter luteus]|uniref:LuxR C-terminal-related transcriptional regulator n=1 Tax=Modicisalibacter luteus TaxID=453962 RepID=A0ABV7LWR7_9GAMM|nr:LuxR C-terminal-related transcriptional regulator [Halomonas lutea]GHB02795.1 helix-turn-helix transcriptional regulator [Halomonas lutea]